MKRESEDMSSADGKMSNHGADIFNSAATNCFIGSALGRQQGIG